MDARKGKDWTIGLPYVDNARTVCITVGINLAVAFLFFFGRPITLRSILLDASICGVITSFIDVPTVLWRIKRLRPLGRLPKNIPESALAMRLPRNPLLLSLLLGVLFGAVTPLFNFLIIRFYEVSTFSFTGFALWRILYTCFLSAKIVEIAVFRYVQPDCASETNGIMQHGDDAVKDPLPRVSTFKQWFNTVTDDFGFNVLVGLLLGGTLVQDHNVIIAPVYRSGIAISALILGIIVTTRMVYPLAKTIKEGRDSGQLPTAVDACRWVAWLPRPPAKFALALLLPVIVSSMAVFQAVFSFFGFEVLDFFQFFFIRTLFVSLLSKGVVRLALLRYMQPEQRHEPAMTDREA